MMGPPRSVALMQRGGPRGAEGQAAHEKRRMVTLGRGAPGRNVIKVTHCPGNCDVQIRAKWRSISLVFIRPRLPAFGRGIPERDGYGRLEEWGNSECGSGASTASLGPVIVGGEAPDQSAHWDGSHCAYRCGGSNAAGGACRE